MTNPIPAFNKKLQELIDQGIDSEEELNKHMDKFVKEHNARMERVNKALGKGIEVLIRRAEDLTATGEFSKANEICTKILKSDPTCEDALLLQAEHFLHEGKLEKVWSNLNKVLDIDPHNPGAHFQMSGFFFHAGDLRASLTAINQNLELEEEYFDNTIMKAQILFLLNDKTYQTWLKKTEKIDKQRYKNFMKNYWIEKEEYI